MISEELEFMVYQCFDGALSEADKKALFCQLDGDREAMALYCRCAALDASLLRIAQAQLQIDEPEVERLKPTQKRQVYSAPMVVLIALGAVAMLILTFSIFSSSGGDAPIPLVGLKPSSGTQFNVINRDGKRLDDQTINTLEMGSRLVLTQGTAELKYESGVRSIITAPAEAVLTDASTLNLDTGSAWFYVPEQGKGFKVSTNKLEVVDLGTEFGVSSKAIGQDSVHVFSGEVIARAVGENADSNKLRAGQARRVNMDGKLSVTPASKDLFLSKLPPNIEAYEGPLRIAEGNQVVSRGGVGYTLTTNKSLTPETLKDGEWIIDEGGRLSIVFTQAVDLELSSADIPYGHGRTWNSDDDFGTLSITGGSLSKISDPNKELNIERLSKNTYRWRFTNSNHDKQRTPSLQTWKVHLKEVREFSFSKHANSSGRSALMLNISSQTTQ